MIYASLVWTKSDRRWWLATILDRQRSFVDLCLSRIVSSYHLLSSIKWIVGLCQLVVMPNWSPHKTISRLICNSKNETKIITQRVRCECSDWLTCVPKPARRVLRRQIDTVASSLSTVYTHRYIPYVVCSCLNSNFNWIE